MNPLFPPNSKGLCFIVSAPTGTGKTTLVQLLTDEFPNVIANISYTTRKPREDEIDGKHYHFIDEKEFKAKIAESNFLEYINLYGNYYGSSQQWISEQLKEGKHVILVIDTQGAMHVKEKISAISIFISPPSIEELENRLANRKTETPENIQKRLIWVREELKMIKNYDYHIINDDLATAYQVLRSIIIAEAHRIRMNEKNWRV